VTAYSAPIRNGVDAVTAPGMATHQAAHREERASTGTMSPNGLIGVCRARRKVATPGGASRTVLLIDPDDGQRHPSRPSQGPSLVLGRGRSHPVDRRVNAAHRPATVPPVTAPARVSPVAARRAWIIAFLNSLNGSPALPGPVLTRYAPTGTNSRASTNRPRSWRRRRFLITALPTFRLIAKANCGRDQESCSRYVTVTEPDLPRRPDRRNAENVCRDRIRSIRVLGTGWLSPGRLRREPMTPFQSARPNDGATGPGRHPFPEAMGLGALAHVRLVRSFHSSHPSSP
jgi:hypothetical protein